KICHPYTQALFAAVPNCDPEKKKERIQRLQGEVNAKEERKGCCFKDRCPYRKDICDTVPPYLLIEKGHTVACHKFGE
ncbi:MAG: oligopeptide/dipeptide ABC transporter ATP-binding protein, partial [Anaerovoracaceae bacterium]